MVKPSLELCRVNPGDASTHYHVPISYLHPIFEFAKTLFQISFFMHVSLSNVFLLRSTSKEQRYWRLIIFEKYAVLAIFVFLVLEDFEFHDTFPVTGFFIFLLPEDTKFEREYSC